jgi:hypothetical protein
MQSKLSKFKSAFPVQLIHKSQKDQEIIGLIETKLKNIIPEDVFLKESNLQIIRVASREINP